MSWVVGCRFLVVVTVCRCLLCCFPALSEGASETLDISVSHYCAWTWSAMEIACACVGSDLYVMLSGGFSFKDIS